jgi:hypothetical protein
MTRGIGTRGPRKRITEKTTAVLDAIRNVLGGPAP